MTLEHSPLDPAGLSPAAQKALGSPPGRMMASRGLVPLPPADQIAVLYQLAIDADQNLSTAARTTAMGLPDIAVLITRRLGRDGVVPPMQGWPIPVEPPARPPTVAAPSSDGGNRTPIAAPTAMPPQAPCCVGFSCFETWTLPSSSFTISATS